MAVVRARGRAGDDADARCPRRAPAVSAYLLALYNFAITGSVRPDALYPGLGTGRGELGAMGQGLFGLTLDARYGLAALRAVSTSSRWAAWFCPAGRTRAALGAAPVLVYYLTVAAADNWSGAVCNLGPLLHARGCRSRVALVALVRSRPGAGAASAPSSWPSAAWSALLAVDACGTTPTPPTIARCSWPAARSLTAASTSRTSSSARGRRARRACGRASSCGPFWGRVSRLGATRGARIAQAHARPPRSSVWPRPCSSPPPCSSDGPRAGRGRGFRMRSRRAPARPRSSRTRASRASAPGSIPASTKSSCAPAREAERCACAPRARACCGWPAGRRCPFPRQGSKSISRWSAVVVLQGRRGAAETLWRQRTAVEAPDAVALG